MDPVSPVPAIVALALAILTSAFIAWRFGAPPAQGRFVSIDGLRGYLAFFVFLHHASVWYFYFRTGVWQVPPSHLYTHFGQSSVAMFFMITAFLFFSKLLDGRRRGIDWTKLYVSRVMRLAPLYLFTMCLLFGVVAVLSHGVLYEPPLHLFINASRWLLFTAFGAPSLNGIDHTYYLVAGVTWTLPYEWFFYFSLPLLALTLRIKTPLPYFLVGLFSIAGIFAWHLSALQLLPFLGGIVAALLYRIEKFRQFSTTKSASFLIILLLATTVLEFPGAFEVLPLIFLSLAFAFIACGNNFFTILASPVSRTLGEISYSLYLLHGLALFTLFKFVIGMEEAKTLSSFAHWMWIVGLTPVLIVVCFCTFRFIERPAMRRAASLTAFIRARLPLRVKAVRAA